MIKKVAIRYMPGTIEKNCSLCYQSETNVATGMHCHQYDLPTSIGNWCGLGIVKLRPVEVEPVKQNELF